MYIRLILFNKRLKNGLVQLRESFQNIRMSNNINIKNDDFQKYNRAGLSKEFSLELKSNLITLMESKKPYLNNELRLNDIADYLKITRNQASQVINEHFDKGFFDFINFYRIKEAINLMESDKNNKLTIIEIIFKSGFNNKVSFYKHFKKYIGKTPLDFKNNLNAKKNSS